MAQGERREGARVALVPFDDGFWDAGLGWYNDPEIIELTSDDLSPLTEEQFRETIQIDLDSEQSVVFGITDLDGKRIGIGMLRNVDPIHLGCDLHITIGDPDYRGHGYGAEAITLMRDYAFHTLGQHKVISTPFAKNTPMVKCLAKCGFEQEGLLRDALLQGKRFLDVVVMGVINPRDVRS